MNDQSFEVDRLFSNGMQWNAMHCSYEKEKKTDTHNNVIYLSHKETQPQIISAKDTGWYYGFYLFLWTINL
jgi:hypothetical protein